MKVKAKYNITENGKFILAGMVFDIDKERAVQLGNVLEILDDKVAIQDEPDIIPDNKKMPEKKIKKK